MLKKRDEINAATCPKKGFNGRESQRSYFVENRTIKRERVSARASVRRKAMHCAIERNSAPRRK